jgi:murein DD-endopeptidase MepM/ murein hydrolase activator NlpD
VSRSQTWVLLSLLALSSATAAQIYAGPPKPGKPLAGYERLSQGFGEVWSRNSTQVHTGLDLVVAKGNRVFSIKKGIVYKTGNLGGTDGDYVVVFNSDGTSNGYLHINISVKKGDAISAGQVVGTVYKDHLHFNQCKQADGCQHGAFPNPTFLNQPTSNMTKYYVKPPM